MNKALNKFTQFAESLAIKHSPKFPDGKVEAEACSGLIVRDNKNLKKPINMPVHVVVG